MSGSRASGLLLRLYPPAWRARYGEELEALIVESTGGQRMPWRMRVDVALAGGRERLHAAGLAGDVPPGERIRAGSLLVLCAWVLCVVAGAVVQKFSEHWQDATPAASQVLPRAAFRGLEIAAAIGSVLVLAGIAAALPRLVATLRGGGWLWLRRRVVIAALLSLVAAGATVALIVWAHTLDPRQRDGHDPVYAIGFAAWALLVSSCLAAWTAAAVTAARRLSLPVATLGVEAWLASAVTVAMAAMTAATLVWWAALADTAPWFLAGATRGSASSPLAPQLLAAAATMLLATGLGALGTSRALNALPRLGRGPS